MVTEIRAEQFLKAQSPILVTEFGIVIEVRPEQSEKAAAPIFVTPFSITTFLILFRWEYQGTLEL